MEVLTDFAYAAVDAVANLVILSWNLILGVAAVTLYLIAVCIYTVVFTWMEAYEAALGFDVPRALQHALYGSMQLLMIYMAARECHRLYSVRDKKQAHK